MIVTLPGHCSTTQAVAGIACSVQVNVAAMAAFMVAGFPGRHAAAVQALKDQPLSDDNLVEGRIASLNELPA
jgi:hypothetical protein